jgi:hypothetical protein
LTLRSALDTVLAVHTSALACLIPEIRVRPVAEVCSER